MTDDSTANATTNGTRSYHYVIHFEVDNGLGGTGGIDAEFVYDHLPDQAEIEQSVNNKIASEYLCPLVPGSIEFKSVAVIDS